MMLYMQPVLLLKKVLFLVVVLLTFVLLKPLATLETLNDEATGVQIVRRSLEEPLRQIVENCGIEGSVVVNKVREGKGDYGFNARTESLRKPDCCRCY
jgi:chaperonin GroEL (HSP60 family)